jgi:toxin ParE1/3/4
MPVAFTPLAEADLESIGDSIAKDGPRRAVTFVQELRERGRRIEEMPCAAALRSELGEQVRVAVFGRYLICYCERDDGSS